MAGGRVKPACMTKRFALTHAPRDVADALRLDALDPFPPRYNIAPTQPVLLVFGDRARVYDRDRPPVRRAMLARWGFIPGWAKDPAEVPLLVNARSETANERPAFRGALRHRRCLVPASAFYLWAGAGTPRSTPFMVRPRDARVLALAGLFETFMAADGSEIDTVLILTREASRPLARIAPREPLAVADGDREAWLDCGANEPADIAGILTRAAPADAYEAVELTSLVNDASHMGPEVQRPADGPGEAP
jgi:putative SOS response-associated peptidase YedK